MERNKLIQNIVDTCHLIHQEGLVTGTGGNVSYRIGDSIYITPSGFAFDALTDADIVCMNTDGNYEGAFKPSKEKLMHIKCYEKRPDINAIVHVHSEYSVALSCFKELDQNNVVPVYTPGYGMRVGKLPALPYMRPGSIELAEETAKVIAQRNSVLLRNHGSVTVGKTLEEAMYLIEEIEENAKIHFILNGQGRPLTIEQIADLEFYK